MTLMVLISGLIIFNVESFLSGLGERPLPDILKIAVRESRFQSASIKEPVLLTFDTKTSKFLVLGERMNEIISFETGYKSDDPDVDVTFYKILPARGISAKRLNDFSRKEISHVTFHPDRSSTPFFVSLKYDNSESVHRFDPFSNAELSTTGI